MFPRVWILLFVGMGWAAGVGGCTAATATRGYPLYPEAQGRLGGNQVARLGTLLPGGAAPEGGAANFIQKVDGRDVSSLDSAFELLPGCHVVETANELVLSDPMVMWSGEVGARAFAFPMKAGYDYLVVVELREGMSGSGRLSIYGVEQDQTGKRTATFAPLPPGATPQACQNPGQPAGSESGKSTGVTSVAPTVLP